MPRDSSIDSDVLEVARAVAADLAARGAHVVWLAGSHARGDAGSHSDIDIGVIAGPGEGPGYRLDRRGHYLLWSLVAEALGRRWAGLQASALAARGEGLAESASAALRLYALAVTEVRPLLDERQSNVVEHAIEIARTVVVPDDDEE